MFRGWYGVGALVVVAVVVLSVREADGLSFELTAGKELCFHEITHKSNKVLAFFDVVSWGYGAYVYVKVKDPNLNVIKSFDAESEGRVEFTAEADGEYSFCFHNPYTATEVSFWVNIENDFGLADVIKEEHVNDMVYSVERLNSLVSAAKIDLSSFKAREARHRQTAESNRRRVTAWAAIECVLIVLVAGVQIYRIRKLFENKRSI